MPTPKPPVPKKKKRVEPTKEFDAAASSSGNKKFIHWLAAVETWEVQMDKYRDDVRKELKGRVRAAIKAGDWAEAIEDARCWFIFRRAWKRGVRLGKRRIKLLLWSREREPMAGRVDSRNDKGRPVPRGRPTYKQRALEASTKAAKKRLYKKAKTAKSHQKGVHWKKHHRRGRPKLRADELSRPRPTPGRRRGRPRHYKKGLHLGHHLLKVSVKKGGRGYKYVY